MPERVNVVSKILLQTIVTYHKYNNKFSTFMQHSVIQPLLLYLNEYLYMYLLLNLRVVLLTLIDSCSKVSCSSNGKLGYLCNQCNTVKVLEEKYFIYHTSLYGSVCLYLKKSMLRKEFSSALKIFQKHSMIDFSLGALMAHSTSLKDPCAGYFSFVN